MKYGIDSDCRDACNYTSDILLCDWSGELEARLKLHYRVIAEHMLDAVFTKLLFQLIESMKLT